MQITPGQLMLGDVDHAVEAAYQQFLETKWNEILHTLHNYLEADEGEKVEKRSAVGVDASDEHWHPLANPIESFFSFNKRGKSFSPFMGMIMSRVVQAGK